MKSEGVLEEIICVLMIVEYILAVVSAPLVFYGVFSLVSILTKDLMVNMTPI